mmetsp:Transcript_128016/g.410187  ORF Transcript_128016/g.410187 Transcript_128016/m.410187 type:complete len:249 (-) Transcript_128016:110-856(-)
MTCLDLLARRNPPLCDTASDYFRRGPTLAERRRKGLAPLQQGLQDGDVWRARGVPKTMIVKPATVFEDVLVHRLYKFQSVGRERCQVLKQWVTDIVHGPLHRHLRPFDDVLERQTDFVGQDHWDATCEHNLEEAIAPITEALWHEAEHALPDPVEVVARDVKRVSDACPRSTSQLLQVVPRGRVAVAVHTSHPRIAAVVASEVGAVLQVASAGQDPLHAPLADESRDDQVLIWLKARTAMPTCVALIL